MKANITILLCIIFYLYGNVGTTFLHIPRDYFTYALCGYGFLILILYKQKWTVIQRLALLISGSAFGWLCLRYIIGEQGAFRETIFFLILPAFLISIFPYKEIRKCIELRVTISRFLYCFFIIECSLAILEFAIQQHIFGWEEMTYAKGLVKYDIQAGFRSVALLKGPLNNALVITVMMLFYLFDPDLPLKRKIPLWLLGLIAIFCFNARAAIVINLLSLFIFVCKGILDSTSKNRNRYLAFFVTTCIVLFLLYTYNWGGRFWDVAKIKNDSSIDVRLRLFNYMAKADWSDYLWGYSTSEVKHEMATKINVKVIENFWILYIFRLGIVATIYFTVLYFCLCKKLLTSYTTFNKVVISLLFISLASANNSIYVDFMPLFTFMLCAYTHSPANGLYINILKSFITQQQLLSNDS